jgi:DNA-binding CsgD family transcriptional regulator
LRGQILPSTRRFEFASKGLRAQVPHPGVPYGSQFPFAERYATSILVLLDDLRLDASVPSLVADYRRAPVTKQRQKPYQNTPEPKDQLDREDCSLSPRETQVLELLGKGKTTKDIAAALDLSTATVGNHRKSLCRKLCIHSTAALIHYATLGRK